MRKKTKFTANAALNAIEKTFICVDHLVSIFVNKILKTKKYIYWNLIKYICEVLVI